MNTSVKVIACMVFLIVLLALSCGSPQTTENERVLLHGEWVGVWKVAEITVTGPEAQTITDPLPGIAIITDKHVSYTGATAPRVELPEDATDAQLAAAFKSFNAVVSKYEVDGSTITAYPIANINPNVKQGDSGTMEYKLEEGNLFITMKTDMNGPIENPYTLKFVRIE